MLFFTIDNDRPEKDAAKGLMEVNGKWHIILKAFLLIIHYFHLKGPSKQKWLNKTSKTTLLKNTNNLAIFSIERLLDVHQYNGIDFWYIVWW